MKNILSTAVIDSFYNEMEKNAAVVDKAAKGVFNFARAGAVVSKRGQNVIQAFGKINPNWKSTAEAVGKVWHSAMSPEILKHIPETALKSAVSASGKVSRSLRKAGQGAGKVGAAVEGVQAMANKASNVAGVVGKPIKKTEDIISKFRGAPQKSAREMSYNLGVLGVRRAAGR